MPEPELTFTETCALLTLLGEAREVPNVYLTNVRRLDLKKANRDHLVKLKLISVRSENRRLYLELTEDGWHRASQEIGAAVPPRAGAAGAALYTQLASLRQYLDRAGLATADFFSSLEEVAPASEESKPADIATIIRKAYGNLASAPGKWVKLSALRASLGDISTAEVDTALQQLARTSDVHIVPESNQKTLSAADRAAAVRIGNEDKHLIAIDS